MGPHYQSMMDVESGTSGHHGEELGAQLREELATSFAEIKLIGEGGMGSVFGARDLGLDRRVAVKALSPVLKDCPVRRNPCRPITWAGHGEPTGSRHPGAPIAR